MSRRKTKRKNPWEQLLDVCAANKDLSVRVEYTSQDLELTITKKVISKVPTTIVVIAPKTHPDGKLRRFVGVAQKCPEDAYLKDKGRAIAAGRALKAFNDYIAKGEDSFNEVYSSSDELTEAIVFGEIPNLVEIAEDLILDVRR